MSQSDNSKIGNNEFNLKVHYFKICVYPDIRRSHIAYRKADKSCDGTSKV